jgi:Flp pilus assembly protein TadD
MTKPHQGGTGFSTASTTPAETQPKQQPSIEHASPIQEALTLLDQGQLQEAEAICRSLIGRGHSNHVTLTVLATVCGSTGRGEEQIALLQKALELNPTTPSAHTNLGVALKRQGHISAAITTYHQALALQPDHPGTHNNLGNALKEQGNLEAAIEAYETAIRLRPDAPDFHNNLGNALKEQGELTHAITAFSRAIALRPLFPEAHNNLGNALMEQGRLDAAIACYRKAIEINHTHLEAHNNLGIALRDQGELEASIDSFYNALALNPNNPDAHNNLGTTLKQQGRTDAAINSYRTALQLKPDYAEAHFNLGNALKEQGHLDFAIASYQRALKLRPHYAEAGWNQSLAYLLSGNYKKGWELFDSRFFLSKPIKPDAEPKCTPWQGENIPQGTKLLLISEQGYGDTLHLMRYAKHLRQHHGETILCAPPKLHGLIRESGVDPNPITPEQANAITDELWAPLMSLPRLLEASPDNPITTDPYIFTANSLERKWGSILSTEQNPLVGINWQGNPKHEKSNLAGRSFHLETLAPLAQTRASLLSLQKGFGSEQLAICSFRDRFVSCQDLIAETWDFLETAAIISHCDLVITNDTCVAHLAGGMGKATWLLLTEMPDWRWGTEGETSFWYPSMRLFRQREKNNWDEVIKRVATELQRIY